MAACGLCNGGHDVKGLCPARSERELEERYRYVKVETAPSMLLVFWNDHGPACTCMKCVIERSERRAAALRRLASSSRST
jgi:hypothetical protein